MQAARADALRTAALLESETRVGLRCRVLLEMAERVDGDLNAAAAARGQRVGLGAEVLLAALREQIAATPDSLDDDETFSESVGKVVQIRRLAADAEEFDGGSSGAYTPMG